jgi:Cft2 family RNA processing exonuclease
MVLVDAVLIEAPYGKRVRSSQPKKSEKLVEKITAGDRHPAVPATVHSNDDAG